MLRFVLLLCAVALSSSSEAKLKQYAYEKIMQSCIGQEMLERYGDNLMAAAQKCEGNDMMDDMPSFRDYLMQLRESARQPVYIPVPVYQPYIFPMQQRSYYSNQYPQYTQYSQSNQVPQSNQMAQPAYSWGYQYQTVNRAKRSVHSDDMEEKMELIKTKLSNITCILKEMKQVNDDNELDVNYMKEDIMNSEMEDELKAAFLENIDNCASFSMCLPTENAENPVKKEIGQFVGFYKCLTKMNVKACAKHDARKLAAKQGKEMPMDDAMSAMVSGSPIEIFHTLIFSGMM